MSRPGGDVSGVGAASETVAAASGRAGSLLLIGAEAVAALFDAATAVESQRHAFRELGLGRAQLAPRVLLDGPNGSTAFSYASRVSDAEGAVAKFGSVVLDNDRRGLPAVNALVTVLDADSGVPRAVLEGNSITRLRTAAASAVAASALVTPGPVRLVVIGAGVQAAAHVEAFAELLDLSQVRLWSRSADRVAVLAEGLAAAHGFPVEVADSLERAVQDATLVLTCTTSATPVIEASWVGPGALVISIGSFAPDHHEVGQDLVAMAELVVVDHGETALRQAGPIIQAVGEGSLAAAALVELGDIVAGKHPGRASVEQIIYYNSVGIGVQDAAAAQAILLKAEAEGAGHRIAW